LSINVRFLLAGRQRLVVDDLRPPFDRRAFFGPKLIPRID
jgi:hypothetical protein